MVDIVSVVAGLCFVLTFCIVWLVVMLVKQQGRIVDLESRLARVSQHLFEGQVDGLEQIEALGESTKKEKAACRKLVAEAQKLIAQANDRVTNARSAYSDGALLRDNAIRRIEKWDAATTDFVHETGIWKDKIERKHAQVRVDLDNVMAAHASSAGALTKRVKQIEEALALKASR